MKEIGSLVITLIPVFRIERKVTLFIRLYNTEGLLELVSSTSYGLLIQDFLALAKEHPSSYNYAQIGDIETKKDNSSLYSKWLNDNTGAVKDGFRESVIPHPVLLGRQDRWFAVPLNHWARFVSICHRSVKLSDTAIYYAFGRERKWSIADSLEFFHKIFYNLESSALARYGLPNTDEVAMPQLMDSIQQGCVVKAIEAYKLNQIQITLWNSDLWQAAISTSSAFKDESITWGEAVDKIPQPRFWILDQPIPCSVPTLGDIQEIEAGHKDYFDCKLRAMLMMPIKMYAEVKGTADNKWLGNIARLIVVEVPESPVPLIEWTTFTVKRPEIEEDATEGRLISDSTVRSVSMIEAWALNEFMHQPVIKVAETPPPRHVRRQSERENRKIPKINTVYLRRLYLKANEDKEIKVGDSEPRHVEWNWQWLVGMHYRQQWYPSEQAHKRILILPYWKGDESKPIKAPGEKVYKVVR